MVCAYNRRICDNVTDDYGHTASAGKKYMLHQVHEQVTKKTYKLIHKKETIFYRESIVYPFVNMSKINGHYIISSRDFADISNYVEHYGLAIL